MPSPPGGTALSSWPAPPHSPWSLCLQLEKLSLEMSQSQRDEMPQPWASSCQPCHSAARTGPSKCKSDAQPWELDLEVRPATA